MKRKPNHPNNPCWECGNRKVTKDYNCHSHCDLFLAWKQKQAEAKKRREEFENAKNAQAERSVKISDVKRKVRKGRY